HRRLPRNVIETEIPAERIEIDLASGDTRGRKRRQFRSEGDAWSLGRVEQRLLTETIAREQQRPFDTVEQPEREHPLEPRNRAYSPARVHLEDHLGVERRAKDDARCSQLVAQLRVVV